MRTKPLPLDRDFVSSNGVTLLFWMSFRHAQGKLSWLSEKSKKITAWLDRLRCWKLDC